MKNLFTLSLLVMAISASVFCQPPQAFKYQAVIRDASGEIMSNQSVYIRINIHNEIPEGIIIYQEIFSTTTNQFGLVNLEIGLGTPVIGSFQDILWAYDTKYIEVELSFDGGVDYYSLGTNELLSVPYALYSGRSADSYWGLYNGCIYFNSGNVGIGTSNPLEKLHVADHIRIGEDPSYPTVYGEIYHEGGGTGFKINANAGGGGWADLLFQTNGTTKMFIESGGNVGIGTTSPTSRLDVQGNITIRDIATGDIAIQLGKGLDYAEGFNVTDKTQIEPGTILCIDTENPGKLKISENPYDKTVAGIVAGANGLGSGVRLGTQEFDCDVALAGRVYCNTIASSEDIEPGDMLTTSAVPGYAMKATDNQKAQGAIIGKAMESLKKGEKRQILVLVTLQ